jgi:hypothetical protein
MNARNLSFKSFDFPLELRPRGFVFVARGTFGLLKHSFLKFVDAAFVFSDHGIDMGKAKISYIGFV